MLFMQTIYTRRIDIPDDIESDDERFEVIEKNWKKITQIDYTEITSLERR